MEGGGFALSEGPQAGGGREERRRERREEGRSQCRGEEDITGRGGDGGARASPRSGRMYLLFVVGLAIQSSLTWLGRYYHLLLYTHAHEYDIAQRDGRCRQISSGMFRDMERVLIQS